MRIIRTKPVLQVSHIHELVSSSCQSGHSKGNMRNGKERLEGRGQINGDTKGVVAELKSGTWDRLMRSMGLALGRAPKNDLWQL